MSIQRLYSLPNCTLRLEGTQDNTSASPPEVLSNLTEAECQFPGIQQSLTGGKEFLVSLVTAVSRYGQAFLSGVHVPASQSQTSTLVHLERLGENQHRLIAQPTVAVNGKESTGAKPIQIDLTTMQLFDLVEAIDQFFADTQTLPDLSPAWKPVQARYVQARVPVVQRAAPAALGISGLALAAIALFFVPVPEIERPTEPASGSETSESTEDNLATTTPEPDPIPVELPTPEPETSVELPTPEPSSQTPPTERRSSLSAAALEDIFNSSPEITDSTQLYRLNWRLFEQVDRAWSDRANLDGELVYRVTTGSDGAILGYKPVNRGAIELGVENTPLADLIYIPTESSKNSTVPEKSEPIAQFKVVFTPAGIVQVSPWWGFPETPRVTSQITDPSVVDNLNQNLYDLINRNWKTTPTFDGDLLYRVGVSEDGKIADYEPLNQSAYKYLDRTPLPSLREKERSLFKQPQAQFQVIFTPTGTIQVTPWQGY
ncbi:MAG: DUF4335 domain-containing protein [Hormoscilla sp. SP5CHS1]|nr:DUF4335 domain-containing protein [Hormoscilla sp. SP5CHS1]